MRRGANSRPAIGTQPYGGRCTRVAVLPRIVLEIPYDEAVVAPCATLLISVSFIGFARQPPVLARDIAKYDEVELACDIGRKWEIPASRWEES